MSDSITELNKLSSYDSATGNIPDQDGGVGVIPALVYALVSASTILPTLPKPGAALGKVGNSAPLATVGRDFGRDALATDHGGRGTLDRFFDRNKNKNNIILTEQKQEQKNSKKDSNKDSKIDSKKDSNKENSYDLASAAAAAIAAAAAEKLRQTTQDVGTKITSFDTSVPPNTTSVGTNTQSDVPIFKSKLEKLKFLIDKHFEKINKLI